MDALETFRDLIEKILLEHAATGDAHDDIKTEPVFDRQRDRYLLVDVGWDKDCPIHYCLVHVDIIDGKVWIQYDGTEDGIATELAAAGVPKDRIVLGFRPPEVRP